MSRVGLVTVLFNCPGVLADFFEGLAKQDFEDYTLYIIDNSTNDASYIEASKLIDFYHLNDKTVMIKNDNNVGIAKANNQGIEKSILHGTEYTLLLNNDITWESNDIISSLVKYSECSNIDIVVPKILFHDSRRIWCAGGRFVTYKGTTIHRGELEEDNGQYNKVERVDYAPTCFMLIKNNLFSVVGLMDERFFVYYDDTDFVWRAMKKNKTLYYYPSAIICHKVSSSTGGYLTPFSVYQCTKNRLLFIRKNYSFIKSIIPLSFFFISRLFCFSILRNCELRTKLILAIKDGLTLDIN